MAFVFVHVVMTFGFHILSQIRRQLDWRIILVVIVA